MANRFPLVINNSSTIVGELQSGDALNLSLSGIYDGAGTGLAGQFLKANGNGTVSWTVSGDVFLSSTQTLQNKTFTNCTISGGSNTISNIGNSSLVNNSINVNGTAIPLGGSVTTPDNNSTYALVTSAPSTNYALIRLQGSNGGATTEFNIYGQNGILITRQSNTNVSVETTLSSLTAGTYLTGTSYNGLAARTWTVDATSSNTASKVVARDTNGDFAGRIITANTFAKVSGTASEFLKADGSVDTNVYLTAESDTLATVTGRGSSTTQNITAASFIKSGGTASEFLKANGSTDSNSYLTQAFPSGTLMLFQQTSAPTGWTKQTTHSDKALRVVTGTVGSGGTSSFSSVFSSRTIPLPSHTHDGSTSVESTSHTHSGSGNTGGESNNHTHTFSGSGRTGDDSPDHSHGYTAPEVTQETSGGSSTRPRRAVGANTGGASTRHQHDFSFGGTTAGISAGHYHGFSFTTAGQSTTHNHTYTTNTPTYSGTIGNTIDFSVAYVDLIIASKD